MFERSYGVTFRQLLNASAAFAIIASVSSTDASLTCLNALPVAGLITSYVVLN
jgi:hypothetical protein